LTNVAQIRGNLKTVAGSLIMPLASLVAVLGLVSAMAWLFGDDKGFGKFALHYSSYLVIFLPPVVMYVGWWRKELSFWQTTFSGFVWYFSMYTLAYVGFGAGHGLFSAGRERAIHDLGMIALTGVVVCFPIALASSGAFHSLSRWVKRNVYEEHPRPGLLSVIGWRDIVEYAVAVGFSLLGLLAGYYIYEWLVSAGVGGYTLRLYYDMGHPVQLFGMPLGATAGVLLFNWVFYGRSRVRISAVALSLVAGLGGVMALSMLSVWFWDSSIRGNAISMLVTSALCMLGYHYVAGNRTQGE